MTVAARLASPARRELHPDHYVVISVDDESNDPCFMEGTVASVRWADNVQHVRVEVADPMDRDRLRVIPVTVVWPVERRTA